MSYLGGNRAGIAQPMKATRGGMQEVAHRQADLDMLESMTSGFLQLAADLRADNEAQAYEEDRRRNARCAR